MVRDISKGFSVGNLYAYRLKICNLTLLPGASLYAVMSADSSSLRSSSHAIALDLDSA